MARSGKVRFVGCGPGAADLLTLRAAQAIAEADIVVWGRSLLEAAAVEAHVRPGAEVIAWPPATMREVLDAYDRARDEQLVVARLKGGDPSVFGEMRDELAAVRERGLAWEIVPGVGAVGAAAAAAGVELTEAGDLTVCSAGREHVAPGAGAVLMIGRDRSSAARALRARGWTDSAACAIVHRVSWPDQMVLSCRLDELTEQLDDLGLDGLTLVLVTSALATGQ